MTPGDLKADHTLSRTDWLVLIALFVAAAAFQLANPTNGDTSWLLTVGEKILSGDQLYKDVIETNPPMSVFIYLPSVVAQAISGVSADVFQVFYMLILIAGSLLLVRSIMLTSGSTDGMPRFLTMSAFVLTIIPVYTFSEREHIAVTLILPALVLLATRADRCPQRVGQGVLAGLAMGLALCLKPQFAVAILLPNLYVAGRLRSLRPLFAIENLVTAAVVMAYGVFVILHYPLYLQVILPMLQETYRSVRLPIYLMLLSPQFISVFGAGVATASLMPRHRSLSFILALSGFGFLFAFFEQGKGWPYHLFPAIAIFFILFLTHGMPRFVASLEGRERRSPLPLAAGAIAIICFASLFPFLKARNISSLPLAARIEAIVPHPKILAISYELSIGHPLTRMVGGTWVGTVCSEWLSETASLIADLPTTSPERKERLRGWIAHDRDTMAHDLRVGQPDVVLVDRKTYPWDDLMASGSEAATLLKNYRLVDRAGDIELLARADLAARFPVDQPVR